MIHWYKTFLLKNESDISTNSLIIPNIIVVIYIYKTIQQFILYK